MSLGVKDQPIEYTVEEYTEWRKAKAEGKDEEVDELKPYNFKSL